MNKKLILIIAGAGLISFAATFAITWFLRPAPEAQIAEAPSQADGATSTQQEMFATSGVTPIDEETKKTMTAAQLKNLVYEVREKIQKYDDKLDALEVRKQRLQMAQNILKKDIEQLNNLRIELASTVAGLKEQTEKLNRSRIEIAKIEKENLISIAATYDKMDSASASKILEDMSRAQNDSANDAVKILYYMAERTKAKLLAVLAETKPALAAYFCQKLKQIVEKVE